MKDFSELLKTLGIKFKDEKFLALAFVHKSYLNENRGSTHESNERLEFLGDAVLELVSTHFLYNQFPETQEGDLTNYRSALVRGDNLAKVAKELDLGKYLYLSCGEEKTHGREKDYLLANTTEALIGAIYLDQGYEVVKNFIDSRILVKLPEILEQKLHIDAKSEYQEKAQEKTGITPEYKLISSEGPDHDKIFLMGVYLNNELKGEGKGSSKQLAEQTAAADALVKSNW